MDNVDAGIIRFFASPHEFQWDLRASFADAARQLGVTEGTVRTRFQRLQEQGVVRGWHVMVNPALLDRRLLRVEVPVEEGQAKRRLAQQVPLLEGAHLRFDYLDTGMAVVFYARLGDEQRLQRLVGSMADAEARAVVVPSAGASVDATDWETVRAVRRDPRAPLPDLAAKLGVSTKTVRRRLMALKQGRAVFLTVDTDLSRMEGMFVVEVRIGLHETADRGAWKERILAWPGLVFTNLQGPVFIASRLIRSPRDVSRLREKLEASEGAAWVSVDVVQDRVVLDDWLDAEVARRARRHAD